MFDKKLNNALDWIVCYTFMQDSVITWRKALTVRIKFIMGQC